MFPFPITKPKFQYPFGVKVLADGREMLIKSERYDEEVWLKQELLQTNPSLYYQLMPEAEEASRECTEILCNQSDWLEPLASCPSDQQPFLWLSKQVQEDLLIIDGSDDQSRLIGGVVCFPSGWSVEDKMGQSMVEIHSPVPTYEEKLQKPVAKLLKSLKPGRAVWRVNWGLRPSCQLDQSPQYSQQMDQLAEDVTDQDAGDRCFFRLEYQTLSRMPRSGHILFTIHTRQTKLSDVDQEDQSLLLSNLESCPDEILKYKGIWPMRDAVVSYLQSSCN